MKLFTLPDEVEGLIAPHVRKTLLLDTNLLVLLMLGSVNPKLIGTGALNAFELRDYVALAVICAKFPLLVTTPHVLTEACHLADKDIKRDPMRSLLYHWLLTYSANVDERTVPFKDLTLPSLTKIGVADAVLQKVCGDEKYLLMTTDYELSGIVSRRHNNALNFNHVRDMLY